MRMYAFKKIRRYNYTMNKGGEWKGLPPPFPFILCLNTLLGFEHYLSMEFVSFTEPTENQPEKSNLNHYFTREVRCIV